MTTDRFDEWMTTTTPEDHSRGLSEAWATAEAAIRFPVGDPRYQHGDWRLRLTGPWPMQNADKRYWAIAEPYNGTGDGFNREIEAVGPTPAVALARLVERIRAVV